MTSCWVVSFLFSSALAIGCVDGQVKKTVSQGAVRTENTIFSLNMEGSYRYLATDAEVSTKALLQSHGAVFLLVDELACESCLGVDLEVRAIRSRLPKLDLYLVVDSSKATQVAEYLRLMRVDEKVLVPVSDRSFVRHHSGRGTMTVHLVAGDGRVLFTQVRTPGTRAQFVAEDLRDLTGFLSAVQD